jgi:hypothetical protein
MKKKNTKKQSVTKIVVISDLHIGSTLAMVPEGFITHDGAEVIPNAASRWLNECWTEFNEWIDAQVGAQPFVLVINGDLIEGKHHSTTEIISSEIEDQIEAASMILNPLARRAEKVFIVDGTHCHGSGHEHRVGTLIGAEVNPDTKRCTFPRLYLESGNHVVLCKHHIGTSTRSWTEASQLSSHLAEERIQAAMNKMPMPDVMCVAHRHKFGIFEDSHGICVVTPPWQFATKHARKVVPSPTVRCGGIIIDTSGPKATVGHITFEPAPTKTTRV